MPNHPLAAPALTRTIAFGLLAILLFGLHLRLTVVLGTEIEAPLRADAGQYFAYAHNLANHGVYSMDRSGIDSETAPSPDHFRNPGYPLLILPFAAAPPSDTSLLNIALLQAALSLAVVGLIFLIARMAMPPAAALGVAALTALSPHLINANVYILSESAAAFMIALFLFIFLRNGIRHDSTGSAGWLLSGALLATATLVRPTMQWFLIPAAALIFTLPKENRARTVAWFVAGFLLMMAPWWLRNLIQFGELSNPALTIGTIHHGMYPDFMYAGRSETFGFPYRFDPRSAEITRSLGTVLTEIARRLAEQPAEHLNWFLLGKPLMFWNWNNDAQGAGDVFIYPVIKTPFSSNLPLFLSHEAMYWLHWPLVALGMLGSLLCWLPRAAGLLGAKAVWAFRVSGALLLYFVILHILAAPFPRYSIPILPILYLQAIGTLFLGYRLRRPTQSISQRIAMSSSNNKAT